MAYVWLFRLKISYCITGLSFIDGFWELIAYHLMLKYTMQLYGFDTPREPGITIKVRL